MEGNGLSGRMYPNMGTGMPLQTQNPQSNLQNHPQVMGFPQQIDQQQTNLAMRQPNYPSFNPNPNPSQNGKIQAAQVTNSDEDEPNFQNDQENSSSSSLKRKAENNSNGGIGSGTAVSPWHRMKWTDDMVRLLIMAVYYIGDEVVGPELGSDKKKPGFGGGGGGGGGAMQKKGKWKSVSRAMLEKGFFVSPQQCEDKFNDLNKRYKRVNDILGKGTACKVVENQTLLETMDLSSKLKEEVRKLLSSKHLFFREMCAYHNSCGHATATNANANANANANGGGESVVVICAGEGQMAPPQQQQNQPGQGQVSPCLHSTQLHPSMVQHNHLGNEDEDDDDEDEDDDDDDDDDGEDHEEGRNARKRGRTQLQGKFGFGPGFNQWSGEVRGILQDGSRSSREKKQWMMAQMMELEENGVKYQREALELEKEKLKWLKFSSKKEREMEKMKLANERKRLENERMVLLLKKKEIEFMVVEQQQNPNSAAVNNTAAVNPSCISV